MTGFFFLEQDWRSPSVLSWFCVAFYVRCLVKLRDSRLHAMKRAVHQRNNWMCHYWCCCWSRRHSSPTQNGVPFDDLKVKVLAKLDEGFDSLKFLQRLGEVQMSEPNFSALIQVCNDYLWTKTTVERAFRKFPRNQATVSEKKIFRDVLIQLYKYITKSIIMLLTQVGLRCPQNATAELGNVLELLLKSVQCIAHHESLRVTVSKFPAMNVRLLVKGARARDAELDFVSVMKAMKKELLQRRNTIKASSWLPFIV
ncbi:uncharacterized protein LOC135387882 isoform X1 [Ornithodoros turicata]|uniref:uncharacterized protein LOC135387882 isoform X1 n=1 Tax=Ornithodoros turicata TaxID=34597 RepID=UPI0031388B35